MVANCDSPTGLGSFKSSKGACLPKSRLLSQLGAGGEEGCAWRFRLARRRHISSSLLPPALLQERKQCRWRREINIPACSVPLQTFSKMSGLDHEIKPTQERRRSAGERGGKGWHICRYLSAWGQSTRLRLGSPPRRGRGECTVMLKEQNRKWERVKEALPGCRQHPQAFVRGRRTPGWSPCPWCQGLVHSTCCLHEPSDPPPRSDVNTTAPQAVLKGSAVRFGQEPRIHVWRHSCHLCIARSSSAGAPGQG